MHVSASEQVKQFVGHPMHEPSWTKVLLGHLAMHVPSSCIKKPGLHVSQAVDLAHTSQSIVQFWQALSCWKVPRGHLETQSPPKIKPSSPHDVHKVSLTHARHPEPHSKHESCTMKVLEGHIETQLPSMEFRKKSAVQLVHVVELVQMLQSSAQSKHVAVALSPYIWGGHVPMQVELYSKKLCAH